MRCYNPRAMEEPAPAPAEQADTPPPAAPARVDSLLAEASRVLTRPAVASVLVVVVAFNLIVDLDVVQQNLPMIRRGQLAVHRFLCALSPRSITPKWVRTVEIDDAAHARQGEPTNRAFLAGLVSSAAAGDALAVVLDIKLVAPEGMTDGEDFPDRAADNDRLLAAVRDAASKGVPVVLATWLSRDRGGSFSRMPNVFLDAALPLPGPDGVCARANRACVRLGNINLPTDKRRIPLVTRTRDDGRESASLALSAVSAYEDATDREPRTAVKKPIASAIEDGDFPFASFIPESAFQKIPIDPQTGELKPRQLARGRIVVVGGTWRADLGRGEPVDSYSTPVGAMRGMYLHANYIEALLDDRYSSEVPWWAALAIDLVVGAWLYVQFHLAVRRADRLRLLIIPLALLVASYVTFANLNVYLDFILPLGACFVHLAVEYVRSYRELSKGRPAYAPAAG